MHLGRGAAMAFLVVAGCDAGADEQRVDSVPEADIVPVLTEARCGGLEDCGCLMERGYVSSADCREHQRDSLDTASSAAAAAQLRYDEQCAVRAVNGADDCTTRVHPCDACRIWVGDMQLGENCEFFADGVSECAQGLFCSGEGGVCLSLCDLGSPASVCP